MGYGDNTDESSEGSDNIPQIVGPPEFDKSEHETDTTQMEVRQPSEPCNTNIDSFINSGHNLKLTKLKMAAFKIIMRMDADQKKELLHWVEAQKGQRQLLTGSSSTE